MPRLFSSFLVASLLLACEAPRVGGRHEAGPTTLVLIHTADLHSHLFPERALLGRVDAARGLGAAGEVSEVGGFARIARIVTDVRAGAAHSLYLDSGDLIEGTAAFTAFGGEPELRAYGALRVAAVALGNHDLDPGVRELVEKHAQFGHFPVLAANFARNGSELASALGTSVVLDAQGLRVGVIGVANPSSPSGLARADNLYGVQLLDTASAVQSEIDRLRSKVDVLVAISHLGLEGDEALIRDTSGLDVVLGGHQHLAFDAALERFDCGPALQAERACEARRVFLVHSGALGRYVGELDLSLVPREGESLAECGFDVEAAAHTLIPVSREVPEDPALAALLEPYRAGLRAAGFDTPLAFARSRVERYAQNGGDSALGDLVTDTIRARTGADFSLLNSSGLRADLLPGELTRASFVAALPFSDTLAVLSLTGAQVRALLTQQARVASGRNCQTPFQISGLSLDLHCAGSASSADARIAGSGAELDARRVYTLVTSAYLADGGSGFGSLTEASSRRDLETDPLDVVLESVRALPPCSGSPLPCLDPARLRDGRLVSHGGG